MKKRGQTAVEAVILIAVILIVLLSIISLRDDVMTGIQSGYYASKVKASADKLVQAATYVYHQGEGSRTVVFINIPNEVTNISLGGRLMNITLNISGKKEHLYRKTDYNINGSIPSDPGNYCIILQSHRGYVGISNYNGTC